MISCKKALIGLMVFAASVPLLCAQVGAGTATIRRVTVFRSGDTVEVEISANKPLTPEAQFVTGPNRLVLDFSNATPGSDLRPVAGLGEMTGVRAGLYKSNPPITRVVLDLKSAQPYQLFPSGNNVIVKLGGSEVANAPAAAAAPLREVSSDDIPDALPPIQRTAKLDVQFRNGKLSIWSNKATLAEVLFEVHKRTGAEIGIPAGAEQEQVVASISAAPPRDAMAALLNGSRFNFIMVGASGDGSLRSVILSPREGGAPMISSYTPPASTMAQVPPEAVPDQPEQDATQDAPQQPVEGAEEPIPARDQPDPNNPPR